MIRCSDRNEFEYFGPRRTTSWSFLHKVVHSWLDRLIAGFLKDRIHFDIVWNILSLILPFHFFDSYCRWRLFILIEIIWIGSVVTSDILEFPWQSNGFSLILFLRRFFLFLNWPSPSCYFVASRVSSAIYFLLLSFRAGFLFLTKSTSIPGLIKLKLLLDVFLTIDKADNFFEFIFNEWNFSVDFLLKSLRP